MNKQLAESFRDLAAAAVARVHSTSPSAKDNQVLMAVLDFTRGARDLVIRPGAALGVAMEKIDRDLADDLAKAATVMDDVVASLEAVAAEPATIHGEPYAGVPLHLVGRALRFDTPTRGNA